MELNHNREILVGLVGHPSSGKDTVAAYLVDTHKFTHVSTGDMIRFYIAEHGIEGQDRDTLKMVGTMLREEHGADYLARLALQNNSSRLIVSGLRAIAEAKMIQAAGGIIIACTAPIEIRYERASERGRLTDGVTFEKFKVQEEAEASNPNLEAPNVSAVVAMADYTINNVGTLQDLHNEVDEIIKERLSSKS